MKTEVARLGTMVSHDRWANRETLAALTRAGDLPDGRKAMGHVIAAELLWLARVRGDTQPLPVWPSWSLAECGDHLRRSVSEWDALFDGLSDDGLQRVISYVNTQGERWTNVVRDILDHVLLHSAHHRGQIAMLLRQAGHAPPPTDFIHAIRLGLLE